MFERGVKFGTRDNRLSQSQTNFWNSSLQILLSFKWYNDFSKYAEICFQRKGRWNKEPLQTFWIFWDEFISKLIVLSPENLHFSSQTVEKEWCFLMDIAFVNLNLLSKRSIGSGTAWNSLSFLYQGRIYTADLKSTSSNTNNRLTHVLESEKISLEQCQKFFQMATHYIRPRYKMKLVKKIDPSLATGTNLYTGHVIYTRHATEFS